MISRFSISLVLISLYSTGVPGAQARVVSGFLAEIRPAQSHFAIRNISDENDIVQVIIQLGDNTIFETSIHQTEAMTGEIFVTHDFNITPGPDGFAALSDSAVPLSHVGALTTAIVDGTSTATLNFTGFNAGDAWGVLVDYVDRDGTTSAGSDMNNALLTVSFANGDVLSTTFEGGPTATGNRRSFPFAAVTVPEPNTFLLAALTAVCLFLPRRQERYRP